jgi:imidazolonepropionase-like amidohydrolase
VGPGAGETTGRAAKRLAEIEAKAHAEVEPRPDNTSPTVVVKGGTVMTAAGSVHAPGYIIFEAGWIKAIGDGDPGPVPGAQVVDATEMFVTPGIIDTHSHLGVYGAPALSAHREGNEATAPTTPGVWSEHSFWPQDPAIETAVAGGVTTVQVLPGSANLIGGRSVTLHLVPQRGSRAMRFPGAPEGIKMACGENPKRYYGGKGQAPSTRMGNLRGQREAFVKARAWLDKLDRAEDATDPGRDPELETLALLLEGKLLAQVHCYRADDMLSFLQLAEEFGFRVRSFHHALEAYKIRDVLAAREVSVSTWADWWGFKLEAWDGIPENAALVHAAGGRTVIHSDSPIGIQRLNQEAAKAYHAGLRMGLPLTEDDALRWITANPAWTLGIDHEVGTLEVGKRADIVVWDHHPFSVYAAARRVYIDGVLRHEKGNHAPPWSDYLLGRDVEP